MRAQHMTKGLLLSFILIFTGCMNAQQAPQTYEEKVTMLSFASSEREILELQDKALADKIKEEEDSDDKKLDKEKDEKNSNKMLIVGDSWASFPCRHGSLKKAFRNVKSQLTNDERCSRSSKLGALAMTWFESKQHRRTLEFLTVNKNIKYIYLSLGGNDLMGAWKKTFTAQEESVLATTVFNKIKEIAQSYVAVRPDLKVIVAGYDFPHFKPNHKIWFYKAIYKNMGEPTDFEINEALIRFTRQMATMVDYKNIYFINHIGLSQYYDGVKEHDMAPLLTAHPDQISPYNNPGATGGHSMYPTSSKSMIDWLWLIRDAFHLNERNYDRVMMHTYANVISHFPTK